MKKLFILPIKFYKRFLSPGNFGIKVCIFEPSCSKYAIEALDRFGVFKGLYLATYRIIRCNPFSKGGYDPVPER
jgi:putative membrane protein insertion efficiency factor